MGVNVFGDKEARAGLGLRAIEDGGDVARGASGVPRLSGGQLGKTATGLQTSQ